MMSEGYGKLKEEAQNREKWSHRTTDVYSSDVRTCQRAENLKKNYIYGFHSRNRNRKLLISRAPTKAKSQEPAYSQALNQNKIDRQGSRSRESGRQTVRRLWWMVFGVETGR